MSRLLFAITAGAAVILALPAQISACSKPGWALNRTRMQVHFIGSARSDTLLAGAGQVQFVVAPGHFGPARSRSVYGQVVDVERISDVAVAGVRGARRVVLVPWDYAADCTPTPWTRSAAWLPVDQRGLFYGTLRDSAFWADGLPTFDVYSPEVLPYPQNAARRMWRTQSDSLLSIDQLFSLMGVLPDWDAQRDSPDVATAPLFAWARANPELAKRHPAIMALSYARGTLVRARVQNIRPPIVGTYRFEIALDGGPARTYFARTRSAPISPHSRVEAPPPSDPTEVSRPDGYYLQVAGALTEAALPTECGADGHIRVEGYISMLDGSPVQGATGREWRGKVELDLPRRVFPADTAIAQFARADFERFSRQRRARIPTDTPARFIERPAGALEVEQRIVLDDGRVLELRGERLSPQTVSCSR